MGAPGGNYMTTMPMPQILAEAPEVAPWWGLDDLDIDAEIRAASIRTLDGMDAAARMLAVLQIPDTTKNEGRALVAIVSKAWVGPYSAEWIRRTAGISDSALSVAMKGLEDKGVIRRDPRFRSAGGRTFIVTVSYRPFLSSQGSALVDFESADFDALVDFESADFDALVDSTSAPRTRASRAGARGQSVSSDIDSDNTGIDRLTDVTGAAALVDSTSALVESTSAAPGWWDQFSGLLTRLRIARVPGWPELASLVDLERDPDYLALREACARLYDTYSQRGRGQVRSVRAVVHAIYVDVISDPACIRWATEAWLPEPDAPVYGPPLPPPPPMTRDPACELAWREVLTLLQSQLPRSIYSHLEQTVGLAEVGGQFFVGCPTPHIRQYLERRMYQGLQGRIRTVLGRDVELVLRSESAERRDAL